VSSDNLAFPKGSQFRAVGKKRMIDYEMPSNDMSARPTGIPDKLCVYPIIGTFGEKVFHRSIP
jgi:hypothetical protein